MKQNNAKGREWQSKGGLILGLSGGLLLQVPSLEYSRRCSSDSLLTRVEFCSFTCLARFGLSKPMDCSMHN